MNVHVDGKKKNTFSGWFSIGSFEACVGVIFNY